MTSRQRPLCESLKARIPREPDRIAGFLLLSYEQWGEDVPKASVDPAASKAWPEGFGDVLCTVLANNQIELPGATCPQVTALLVDAPRWPSWYANATKVTVTPPATKLEPDAEFSVTTFGLEQSCHVTYVDDRVGWSCERPGTAVQTHQRWNCTESSAGAFVSTQECQKGVSEEIAFLTGLKRTLQRGHQVWLESLRCKLEDDGFRVSP